MTQYHQRSFSVGGWKAPEDCNHTKPYRWITVTGTCFRCGVDLTELIMRELEDAATPTEET
jgi:hypothetical protein